VEKDEVHKLIEEHPRMRGLKEKIDEHDEQHRQHVQELAHVKERISENEANISGLDKSISDIKGVLSKVATKTDLQGAQAHIDNAVNVVLRDALNAVPGRLAWLLGLIMLLIALMTLAHGFKWF